MESFDLESLIRSLTEDIPAIIAAFKSVLILLGAVVGVILLIGYILRSVAIARMGHRRHVPLWGLAWVPGLRLIVTGGIADYHDRKTVRRKHGFSVLLPVLFFLWLAALTVYFCLLSANIREVFALLPDAPEAFFAALPSLFGFSGRSVLYALAILSGGAYRIFYYIAIYKALEACKKKHVFLDMLLYLLVPFAAPIVLIAVSRHDSDRKKKQHIEPEEQEESAEPDR